MCSTTGYSQTRKKLQTLEISSLPLLCCLFTLVNSHSSSLFSLSWPQTFIKFSGSRIHFSFPVKQVTLFTVPCAWDLQVLLENTLKKWVDILSSIMEDQDIKEALAATKEHNTSLTGTPVSNKDSFSKLL